MPTRMNHQRIGIEYTFDKPGDGLSMHHHPTRDEAHTVEVLNGSVLVYGPLGSRLQRGSAGDTLTIEWRELHEIMALEPGTRVFNRYLDGEPTSYAALQEHERSGYYDIQLSHRLDERGLPTPKDQS